MGKDEIWQKVNSENLVRHRSGTYYLQAKVSGRKIRTSLDTTNLRIAKTKRDTMLRELRSCQPSSQEIRTIGDLLQVLATSQLKEPGLKVGSIVYRKEILAVLERTLNLNAAVSSLTKESVRTWWLSITKQYSATRANSTLGMMKKLCEISLDASIRFDDPTRGIRRLKVPESNLVLPPKESFPKIIQNIKTQKRGRESADLIAFLAYSGLRISELQKLRWEDISEHWICVKGGEHGSKNWETRRVPIIGKMRELLEDIRPENASGKIFSQKQARHALQIACESLNIHPHLTHHDLRHLFITTCVESGVDIPTVAEWVGHKDGGKLLLKRYKHIRDEHSIAEASKVAF